MRSTGLSVTCVRSISAKINIATQKITLMPKKIRMAPSGAEAGHHQIAFGDRLIRRAQRNLLADLFEHANHDVARLDGHGAVDRRPVSATPPTRS